MLTIRDCISVKLNPGHNVQGFVCKDESITDFIQNKSALFDEECLSTTYVFTPKDNPNEVVAYYTASNDALVIYNLPRSRKDKIAKTIPFSKRYIDTFPAIKIGMLGKHQTRLPTGSGSLILDHIIGWIVRENTLSACRFIVVDAHNTPKVIQMYLDKGFELLFSSDTQEKEYFDIPKGKNLPTKYMFYDLLPLTKQYRAMLAELEV